MDPSLKYSTGCRAGDHYVRVDTFNPYSGTPVTVVLAKDLIGSFFPEKNEVLPADQYTPATKISRSVSSMSSKDRN